ncbi:MAG: glycosyl hydrolase-related protein [Actinomycetota bacterium]|nr:glycosyl hydrolase-related protein [Actinomycetota bacterium]
MRFAKEIKRAEKANLLEETERSGSSPVVEGNTLQVEVRPFEVLTLRLVL